MKKLFLLALFGCMAFLGTAQITVYNNSGEDLLVGVQYTLASTPACSIDAYDMQNITDGNNHTFVPPVGYSVLRVGASGTGSDEEFSPCTDCTGSPATDYTFTWSGMCGSLNITP